MFERTTHPFERNVAALGLLGTMVLAGCAGNATEGVVVDIPAGAKVYENNQRVTASAVSLAPPPMTS